MPHEQGMPVEAVSISNEVAWIYTIQFSPLSQENPLNTQIILLIFEKIIRRPPYDLALSNINHALSKPLAWKSWPSVGIVYRCIHSICGYELWCFFSCAGCTWPPGLQRSAIISRSRYEATWRVNQTAEEVGGNQLLPGAHLPPTCLHPLSRLATLETHSATSPCSWSLLLRIDWINMRCPLSISQRVTTRRNRRVVAVICLYGLLTFFISFYKIPRESH